MDLIDAQLEAGLAPLSDDNTQLAAAIEAVYTEVEDRLAPDRLNMLGDYAAAVEPGFPMNGLEVVDLVEHDEGREFKLRNSKKRWISVYVDGSEDGVTFSPTGEMQDLIPSPDISLFALLCDGSSSLTFESRPLSVSFSQHDYLAVKAYGLGLGGYNLPNSEFQRAILPASASAIFDIVDSHRGSVVGSNLLHQDLRGRPTDDPFYRLVEEAARDIITDQAKTAQFYRWYREGDIVNITVDLVKSVMTTFAENPHIVTDLITQTAGQAIARSVVDSWLFPIRLINAVVTAANLGYSIASVVSSEAVTTFVFTSLAATDDYVEAEGRVVYVAVPAELRRWEVQRSSAHGPNGNPLGGAQSSAAGLFSMSLPPGEVRVRVVADGFHPVNQVFTVEADTQNGFVIPTVYLTAYSSAPGNCTWSRPRRHHAESHLGPPSNFATE